MTDWSVRRIQRALEITGGSRYLEVGVEAGVTFTAVRAAIKIAVDPRFRFDTSAHAAPGVEFHEMSSDDYFAALDPRVTFDVVYLDGLHTFEQTYRDLCSALTHTHANSIIIVDDVQPLDVYGSTQDYRHRELRRLHGEEPPSEAWWGDTFKVVPMVHDFHPTLQYATVTTGHDGQLVVWRAAGPARVPALNSAEAITRLTFFDIGELEPVMRWRDESVFDQIEAEIGGGGVMRAESRDGDVVPGLDPSEAQRLGVSPRIHADDFLYRFLAEHPDIGPDAQSVYFTSARASALGVADHIRTNLVPTGLATIPADRLRLLDFASGYGMVGRHYGVVMPEAKVVVSDIHPAAVEFCRRELGLPGFISSVVPEDVHDAGTFDVVVALSFFSHLPETTWERWLRRLLAFVAPGGLLLFTTHGPSSPIAGESRAAGLDFHFSPISEQGDLDAQDYGTTYAHPRFVTRVLDGLPGVTLSEYKMGAWWGGNQDVYVLVREP